MAWPTDFSVTDATTAHRTFNALTGTPMARLRKKGKWLEYAEALKDGMTIDKSAKRCDVHPTTAFRWRHRFLKSFIEDNASELSGIAEADETFFLKSFKGQRELPRPARKRGGKAVKPGISAEQIPVLIARDRNGETFDAILEGVDAEHLGAALIPVLGKDTLLCTDGSKAFKCAGSAGTRQTAFSNKPLFTPSLGRSLRPSGGGFLGIVGLSSDIWMAWESDSLPRPDYRLDESIRAIPW